MKKEKLPLLKEKFQYFENTSLDTRKVDCTTCLDHPPDPIGDIRSADVHRIPYIETAITRALEGSKRSNWQKVREFSASATSSPQTYY